MAEIMYFEKGGPENASKVLELVKDRLKAGDIRTVLVASSYGDTALIAKDVLKNLNVRIIVVGEVIKGQQSPGLDIQKQLQSEGISVIWGTTFGTMSTFLKDETAILIAEAYRRISEGFKVVCEITLIAATQGYVLNGEKVLAIAGTHRGSDTAIVASAAPFSKFKDFEINEILCKPYKRKE